MTFLNPAVLLGLLATAIPVLLHLLNLRKLKKIEFSTLEFLKEMQKNKIRKIKFKQWLLLLLRVLIITCLVIAFARPTIKGLSIAGTASSSKTTAIFILDNTISMSVLGDNGSHINRAKKIIKKIADQFQDGDDLFLISADNINETVNHFQNINEFINNVEITELSDISFTLNEAIVKAAQIIENSKNFNNEIYIISDQQKSSLNNGENDNSDLSRILNEQVKVYNFNLSGENIFNLAVDSIKVNTQIFEINKPINFTAYIKNYSDQEIKNFIVSLFINNERSAQQSINLESGKSTTVNFETVLKNSGLIEIEVELEDDDIIRDNKNYLSIYIPEKISVGYFTNNLSDQNYLEIALQSLSENKLISDKNNISNISSNDLSKYDCIILEGFTNSNKIKEYLNTGKGILIIPSESTDITELNSLLDNLDIPKINSLINNKNDNYIVFDEVDFRHPIFLNLFDEDKKQIESPKIYRHFKIEPSGKGKSIISLIDRSVFLSEYKSGKGKILLMGSAVSEDWSDLSFKPVFTPLIIKSVFYLSSNVNETNTYIAGETSLIDVTQQNYPQIKIEKPDGIFELIDLDNNTKYLQYIKNNTAGNYKVYTESRLIDNYSINIDPKESVTEILTKEDFEKYLEQVKFKGEFIILDAESDFMKEITQARFGSELWRLFLIAALILAVIEILFARSSKKDLVKK